MNKEREGEGRVGGRNANGEMGVRENRSEGKREGGSERIDEEVPGERGGDAEGGGRVVGQGRANIGSKEREYELSLIHI